MLFGDSTWAGAAWASQALEITYTNVTVIVTNTPLTLALNDVTVTADASIDATNVPISLTINDVTVTVTTTVNVSGTNLNVTINDVTVTADASTDASNTPLTVTINEGTGAYGWTEVDSSNTTTWIEV